MGLGREVRRPLQTSRLEVLFAFECYRGDEERLKFRMYFKEEVIGLAGELDGWVVGRKRADQG